MNRRTEVTRRSAIGGLTAGTAVLSAGQVRSQGAPDRKTFVLVHGAWHSGWCWRLVAASLEQQGHRVLTPTLSGLGERSHLLTKQINVTTHVTDICNVLKWEDLNQVVLIGHSYGGFVISGVAEHVADRVGSIVFLDAFMPQQGEAPLDAFGPGLKTVLAAAQAKGAAGIPSPPSATFGVPESERHWVDAKLTPQPIGTFFEKFNYTGGRERIPRKAYVRLAGFQKPLFDSYLAKARSDRSWRAVDLPSAHDAMICDPDRLTQTLILLA